MSMIFYCRVENLFKQDRHKGGSLGCHCMMQRFNIFGSIDYNQTFFQLEGIVFLVFTKSVSIHPSPFWGIVGYYPQNHPQYLSGLLCACFSTTLLKIAIYCHFKLLSFCCTDKGLHFYLALPPGSPVIKLQHFLKLAPGLLFNISANRRAFIGKRVLNRGGAYWVFHSMDCNFISAKLIFLKTWKKLKRTQKLQHTGKPKVDSWMSFIH